MKVSIGTRPQDGPWGGGNHFARFMAEYLRSKGTDVSFDLCDPDLDVILLTEPDKRLRASSYSHMDVLKYLVRVNRSAIVIHRINNTSEARDDAAKHFNTYRLNANCVADHTVFISRWVYRTYVSSGFRSGHFNVIHNGSDTRIWKYRPRLSHPDGKLSMVTHHWSVNPNKGFDIYRRIDDLLIESEWNERLAFTYIGRIPPGFQWRSTRYEEPLWGEPLATELARHDIYLTASINESGPWHVVEAALSGLPILYRESGALPEYCNGFGIGFTDDDFEDKLRHMMARRDHWVEALRRYPFTREKMCEDYYQLIVDLLNHRNTIVKRRRWWRWSKSLIYESTNALRRKLALRS